MTLDDAIAQAKDVANITGNGVLVYRAVHNDRGEYGIAYTLPMWGERVVERIYPEVKP